MRCDSRQLTTAVWKSTMRDKSKNNINHIIQHQNSQVINTIFAGKKQNAKKLKSVQNVLDNPDPAWAKMISNPAPGPIKSYNSSGSDSKNPDPGQHWSVPTTCVLTVAPDGASAATRFSAKITRFTKKITRFQKKLLGLKFLRRSSQFFLNWFSHLLYCRKTFTSLASFLK